MLNKIKDLFQSASPTRRVLLVIASIVCLVYGSFLAYVFWQILLIRALVLASIIVGLPLWAVIYIFYAYEDRASDRRMVDHMKHFPKWSNSTYDEDKR
jgi:cation transporter-like permease